MPSGRDRAVDVGRGRSSPDAPDPRPPTSILAAAPSSPASPSSSARRCCSSCRSRRCGSSGSAGPPRRSLFVVVAALCVAPWTIRNHRVYGRWIAVASEGGVTFWTGNHPLARGDGDLAANVDIKRAELAFRAAHPGSHARSSSSRSTTGTRSRGSAAIRRRGSRSSRARRSTRSCPLGPSYAVHSTRYRVASVASYLLILPAAICGRVAVARGTARAARPRRSGSWPPPRSSAGLVFFPQERFRIPVIDPALIVTAALPAGLRKR